MTTEAPSDSPPSPTDAAEALAGTWTAQVASRGPDDSDNEFNDRWTKLKAQYPDAVKFWSGDWPGTYGPSHRRSWVIVSGVRYSTTEPLLEWCEDQDLEACWAVRLAKSGDPERNIDRPPADDRNN